MHPDHIAIISQGSTAVTRWKKENPGRNLDLTRGAMSGADLSGMDLSDSYFESVNLSDANLSGSHLERADLTGADLSRANVSSAYLTDAVLDSVIAPNSEFIGTDLTRVQMTGANLREADLTSADLSDCEFVEADLSGADLFGVTLFGTTFLSSTVESASFVGANLGGTLFVGIDLSGIKNLSTCVHHYPSHLGLDTILLSKGLIPDEFLRACRIDPVIQRLLTGDQPSQTDAFYEWHAQSGSPLRLDSCFISYSTDDKRFAERLQNALNARGVDYWYAPVHAEWGRKLTAQIDRQIRLRDRVILICSESSLSDSDWVYWEITKAIEEEDKRSAESGKDVTILYPVMIDDHLLSWDTPQGERLRKVMAADFIDATKGKAFETRLDRFFRGLYPVSN